MPSKIQLDENLWFLYICLQKSDLKMIDFAAVGEATSLKAPAARMRYTRLKRQIESGTLIGTHGTPFTGSVATEKIRERNGKRKRRTNPSSDTEQKPPPNSNSSNQSHDEEEKKHNPQIKTPPQTLAPKIKSEHRDSSFSNVSSYSDVAGESEEDSEDEMPLAKLRKPNHGVKVTGGSSINKKSQTRSPISSIEYPLQYQQNTGGLESKFETQKGFTTKASMISGTGSGSASMSPAEGPVGSITSLGVGSPFAGWSHDVEFGAWGSSSGGKVEGRGHSEGKADGMSGGAKSGVSV